jgi:hypothetical protein
MTKALKEFIEKRGQLLDDNNFKQLFLDAYGECLMTSEVQELHNMLLEADIIDSTQIRSELLYKLIEDNLEIIRLRHPVDLNTGEMLVIETNAVKFLRYFLNNTFGFTELEALEFMRDNQKSLDIRLTPTQKVSGQAGFTNYHIEYI